MAKTTKTASKTPKKRSTKYSKLAAVCSKELAAKKAALVRAEKALAKAQKTHADLLSEVARLDMLDRSLKALINGTEPPQNIKYVYTYPNWVWQPYSNQWWYPYPYTYTYPYNNGTYPSNGTYTLTLGATSGGTSQFQGGQYLANGGQYFNFTTNGVNSVYTTATSSASTNALNLASFTNTNSGSFDAAGTEYTFGGADYAAGNDWTSTTAPSTGVIPDLTVDLSTGATQEEKPEEPAEAVSKVGTGG